MKTITPMPTERARGTAAASPGVRPDILFLAPGDVLKGRVEPISWMQTCRAYAELGSRVTLVTLRLRRPDPVLLEAVWEHYGMRPRFRILGFPTPLGQGAPVWWFRVWAGIAATALALRTVAGQARQRRALVVHARLPVLAAPFVVLRRLLPRHRRPLLVFETHSLPKREHRWVVRGVDLVVVNSERLAQDLHSDFGVAPQRVLFAPLGSYNAIRERDKEVARLELGIAPDAAIACYAGKMTEEINEFLFDTAAVLHKNHAGARLLLLGGNPRILQWSRRRIGELGLENSVVLTGFVPPAAVESYLAAADVLIHHTPSSTPIFRYMTPAKAYDYQSARRPIVATDIPLFEEVFGADGDRAIRVVDRTPEGLAAGLRRAFALEDGGRAMADRAVAWVSRRTWKSRCELILRAMGF